MDRPEIFQVRLDRFVYGGDLMGRLPDGRVIFVPFGLPGELVSVEAIEVKNRYIKGKLVEILEVSPERIQPKCTHFGVCGGCHYQHLVYEKQVTLKSELLRDQLTRIGGFEDPAIHLGSVCEQPWNYRNAIQFHLGNHHKPGFMTPHSNSVIEITECHLPETALNDFWPVLDIEPFPGLERIELRAGSDESAMMIFESSTLDLPTMTIEQPVSAVNLSPAGRIIIAGDDYLNYQIHDRVFHVSAGSFFQVNTHMAEKMVDEIRQNLEIRSSDVVLDLYCGVGLFSAFLAPKCRELIGVEISSSACSDFVINMDVYDHVSLYESTAEKALPALKVKPDVVLVDPPRAGLNAEVIDYLVKMKPREIAYVSCDPATLARDLSRLVRGGYQVNTTKLFDLFPQTSSIESITYLRSK